MLTHNTPYSWRPMILFSDGLIKSQSRTVVSKLPLTTNCSLFEIYTALTLSLCVPITSGLSN